MPPHLRHGDGEEAADRAGAVDLGRLVQLVRHGLQAGQQHDHHPGGERLPRLRDDDRDHGGRGMREPRLRLVDEPDASSSAFITP